MKTIELRNRAVIGFMLAASVILMSCGSVSNTEYSVSASDNELSDNYDTVSEQSEDTETVETVETVDTVNTANAVEAVDTAEKTDMAEAVDTVEASDTTETTDLAEADKEAAVTESREGFSVSEISDELFDRMKRGNTYKEDCIVPREDLRYLLVLHKDKDGNTHQGEWLSIS